MRISYKILNCDAANGVYADIVNPVLSYSVHYNPCENVPFLEIKKIHAMNFSKVSWMRIVNSNKQAGHL
jgi:hypothetical protein